MQNRMLKYIICQSRFTSMGTSATSTAAASSSILRSVKTAFKFRRLQMRKATPVRHTTPMVMAVEISRFTTQWVM